MEWIYFYVFEEHYYPHNGCTNSLGHQQCAEEKLSMSSSLNYSKTAIFIYFLFIL